MKNKLIVIIIILCLFITSCKYRKYTVTFLDEEKELSQIEVTYGSNLSDIPVPEKEGYIFVTWLKDGVEYNLNTKIKEDIVLTASWTEEPIPPNMHRVIFDFGTYKKNQTINDGEKVQEPKETPKKEKYKFLGWYLGEKLYDFDTPVTEDITITAKFEKNRILISYDLSGATGLVQVEINKGSIPKKPKNHTKFGYTFTGWTISGKTYNFDKPLYEDTIIKANYKANVYVKVTFDTDGGNQIASQMIISGLTIQKLETPIKEGYTFLYWAYNGEKFNSSMPIEKDITLLAIYEENKKEELDEEEKEEEPAEE